MTYRESRLARAEKLKGWAETRDAQSDAMHAAVHAETSAIPFGQPILVGHHSEKGHRSAIARANAKMGAAVENDRKAADMAARAANIEAQADAAIYDDDLDAIERLSQKLAALAGERERMKMANAAYRKEHRAEMKLMGAWERSQAVPYPSYAITNLGGNISRTRDRIARLQRTAEHGPTDRLISARFASKCEDCSAQIEKGDLIRYNRQQGARCKCCQTEETTQS